MQPKTGPTGKLSLPEATNSSVPGHGLVPARSAEPSGWRFRLGVLLAAGLCFSAAFLVGPSGCKGRTNSTKPSPEAEEMVVVKIAWPADVAPSMLTNFASTWAAKNKAKLEVVRYDPEADRQAPPDADVWAVAP